MTKTNIFLLTLAIASSLISCTNTYNTLEKTQEATIVLGTTSRTAETPNSTKDLTDITLTGTNNKNKTTLGTWKTYTESEGKEIKINTGTWTFELTAKYKTLTYKGTIENKEINKGKNVLTFYLNLEKTDEQEKPAPAPNPDDNTEQKPVVPSENVTTVENIATLYNTLSSDPKNAGKTVPIKISNFIGSTEQWDKVKTALATAKNNVYVKLSLGFENLPCKKESDSPAADPKLKKQALAVKEIIILQGTKTIGNFVFQSFENLEKLTLPGDITQYGDRTFENCNKLSYIDFKGTMAQWCSFDHQTSRVYPQTGGKNGTNYTLIIDGNEISDTLTIPEGITTFGKATFRDCSKITTVNFPTNTITLSDRMFANCTSLNNVEIPSYITDLPSELFYQCNSLTNITFAAPNNITTMAAGTFAYTALTTFTFPENIETIQGRILSNCTSLQTVTIPAGATIINADAFSGCTSLTTLEIPAGITKLGKRFIKDSGVTSLVFKNTTGWKAETTPIDPTIIGNATTMATECKTGLYLEKELIRQ